MVRRSCEGGGVNCWAKVTAGTSSAPRSRQISRVTRNEANVMWVWGRTIVKHRGRDSGNATASGNGRAKMMRTPGWRNWQTHGT